MSEPFRLPRRDRVIGVDFSGAKDAHKRIWLCEGRREGDAWRFDPPQRLDAVAPGAKGRAHAALVEVIAAAPNALIALDAPFGLPEAVLDEGEPWTDWLAAFPQRHPDPGAFRDAMNARTGSKELKRVCDRLAKTPWCAWNLRMHRQSWAMLAQVLAPLQARGAASFPPMTPIRDGVAVAVEICPAASLKRRDLYLRGYKGPGEGPAAQRAAILKGLGVDGEPAAVAIADPGGDALDSLVAALAGAEAMAQTLDLPPLARREAWVFT